MKQFLFILLLSTVNNTLHAQIFNDLHERDTVVLIFEKDVKFNNMVLESSKKHRDEYHYKFNKYEWISFQTYNKQFQEMKKIKKNELAKKKLIYMQDIYNYGYQQTLNSFFRNKFVFYILDRKKIKCRKIILKRIYLMNLEKMVI